MSDAMTRRAFAERLALAAAAPLIALDVPPAGHAGLAGRAGPAPAALVQQPDASPLAKALAEAIRLRYGDRLSADDLNTITAAIESRLHALERLSQVALTNADEPDFVFSAYRAPEP